MNFSRICYRVLFSVFVLYTPFRLVDASTTVDVFMKYPNKCFIETGSYEGDGILLALQAGFNKIYSIEIAPFYSQFCKRKFANYSSVTIIEGDSTSVLPLLMEQINEPTTFWLDGHYSGGNTKKGDSNSPIIAELRCIKNHIIKTHTIMIDDIRLFGGAEFDYIQLDEILKLLLEINPDYQITYEKGFVDGDVLVAHIFQAESVSSTREEFSKENWNEATYPYSLSVCSIFKDEAPYLKEWIEYNKLLGVEHFILYNNESTDNYLEVLKPYINSGEVVVIDWPGGKDRWAFKVQAPAIFDAVKRLQGVSKWLAIIDIDEFLLPKEKSNLVDFLKDYESYGGVFIWWQNYGTSWLQDLPGDKLMIEALTLKAEEKSKWNYQGKSIVRPDRIDTSKLVFTPHVWAFLPPYICVNPNKKIFNYESLDIEKIQLNHYVHRSENYFYTSKIAKKTRMEGYPDYAEEWRADCNKIEDKEKCIFKFVPALREKIFGSEIIQTNAQSFY